LVTHFEPIKNILKEKNEHFHVLYAKEWLKELGESLEAKIQKMDGEVP
jgi:hypothetical protein